MSERTATQDRSGVEPYEARGTVPTLTASGSVAAHEVMTAVNGFYYPGDRSDAVLSAIAWLQTHPETRAALFPDNTTSEVAHV